MQKKTLAVLIAVLTLTVAAWTSPKERVLYSFNGVSDGGYPNATVIPDQAGNLYGASGFCFNGGSGNIFELKRGKHAWNLNILYTFTGGGDGGCPESTPVFDNAGNLFGATVEGGTSQADGVVFSLTRSEHWTESVFYEFQGGNDGFSPDGVILDQAGNIYGTASGGEYTGYGVAYQLSPNANGSWTYTAMHEFTGGSDGGNPSGDLVMDAAGNLYGIASEGGGSCSCGVVYELSPNGKGTWTQAVLYAFQGMPDGSGPQFVSLVFDRNGNLYGTTVRGGANNDGTIFELSKSNGVWKEKVLHSFAGTDGLNPQTGVAFGPSGDLYGVTTAGGAANMGVAYKLSHSHGAWKETLLHSFTGAPDGAHPSDRGSHDLLLDKAGRVYGTTSEGGSSNAGTVFEITP